MKEKKEILQKIKYKSRLKPNTLSHISVKTDIFCNEPIVYQDAEDKYALLFCDNKMVVGYLDL